MELIDVVGLSFFVVGIPIAIALACFIVVKICM